MKSLLPFLARFVLPVLACTPVGVNAAVDPSIIPADARWVAFVDLNALRSSPVGKQLVAAAEKAQFERNDSPVGIDLQKALATIGTATAYGSNFSSDPNAIDGTLVLQGTPDLRKITESMLLQATIATPEAYSEVTDLPFPAYAIHPKNHGDKPKGEVIVAYPPEALVLVSKSRAQILRARDLFRDHKGSVAQKTDAPLAALLGTADGAFAFASTVVPSENVFPEDQPQARILRMTRSGAIALGESNGKTFAHAQLIASSDAMADKLMKIVQGMTAMLSLAETNDKQLADFLNSAEVTREGNTVKLNLAYSSDRLAEMVTSLVTDRQRQHRGSPAEHGGGGELIIGESLAQWNATAAAAGETDASPAHAAHTIEKVALKTGALISLGHESRGGRPVRFERVEITPSEGGAPLTFQTQFMNHAGPRNRLLQFQFPGADGSYTIKVSYVNDPAGKAVYAVSLRQPKPTVAEAEPAKSP